MKVVLDANILVSALIKAGKPHDLFNKLTKGKQLVLSRSILEEFLDVIEDLKMAKFASEQDVNIFLNKLGCATKIVKMKSKFRAIEEDPDDDIILRAAYDGKADYIVSGDKHILALKKFKRIRILTIDEMLDLLKS